MTDPTANFIAFLRGDDLENALHVGTVAEDDGAVRRAWQQVVADHGLSAGEITEIFSTWQPSAIDSVFIRSTFGDIKLLHRFDRPDWDGWDAAFAQARAALEAEEDGESAPQEQAEMPILRSASLPDSADIKAMMPWVPVAGDDVYATVARIGPTPHGTIGMLHLLRNQLAGEQEFADRLTAAIGAVPRGLRYEVGETADGTLGQLTRSDNINASAAIMLPDFHSWVAGMPQGWTDVLVSIPCPDFALLAATGSAIGRKLEQDIREAGQQAPELRPTLLRVTAGGIELVAEGGR